MVSARILCFLVLLPGLLRAAPGLYLTLDKTTLEQGRFIRAQVFAVDVGVDLQRLDLTPLQQQFGVEVGDDPDWVDDERWPNAQVQRLRLKLYPHGQTTR